MVKIFSAWKHPLRLSFFYFYSSFMKYVFWPRHLILINRTFGIRVLSLKYKTCWYLSIRMAQMLRTYIAHSLDVIIAWVSNERGAACATVLIHHTEPLMLAHRSHFLSLSIACNNEVHRFYLAVGTV